MRGLKKFLTNKNTITFLGIVAGVITLYIGYNYRVSTSVTLISVPVAKVNIATRGEVTDESIKYIQIPKSTIANYKNIITDKEKIVHKYVSYNTMIPSGSFFFSNSLMGKEEMPDAAIDDIPDGYTVFTLPVTLESTLGNSIYPGDYIDLYVAGKGDTGKILYGKFIESIQVLAVKDTKGQPVFESTTENRIPANLLFAVPDDYHQLLEKAKRVNTITITPVLRNKKYTAGQNATAISSTYLKNWVLSKAESITLDK